jgi:hypothetical protein
MGKNKRPDVRGAFILALGKRYPSGRLYVKDEVMHALGGPAAVPVFLSEDAKACGYSYHQLNGVRPAGYAYNFRMRRNRLIADVDRNPDSKDCDRVLAKPKKGEKLFYIVGRANIPIDGETHTAGLTVSYLAFGSRPEIK